MNIPVSSVDAKGALQPAPEDSLERYIASTTSPAGPDTNYVTVDRLLLEIQLLERQTTGGRIPQVLRVCTPFISFIDRYALAIDNMAQYKADPACLIWGCLRTVLKMAMSVPFYFDQLLRCIEKFGFKLSLYNRYDEMFRNRRDFQLLLQETYKDTLVFLRKAQDALKANMSASAWFKRIWVNFEQEFADILQSLERRFDQLNLLSTVIHRSTLHNHVQKQDEFNVRTNDALQVLLVSDSERRQDQVSLDMLAWLRPVDYLEDLRRSRDKRARGTCQWISKHPFFTSWTQDVSKRVGWIHGGAGMGKTVLATSIIEQVAVLNKVEAVAYFMFDHEASAVSRTSLSMVRTLISQLLHNHPSGMGMIQTAFKASRAHGRGQMTWLDSPLAILRNVIANLPGRVFIILDGLDEASDLDNHLPEILSAVQSASNCYTLFVSRHSALTAQVLVDCHQLALTKDFMRDDIRLFLSGVLPASQLNETLLDRLCANADGWFLCAHFLAQEVKTAISPDDVAETAASTPSALQLYYERFLDRLKKKPPKWLSLAADVFLRILYCLRPLSWEELECSLGIDPEHVDGVLINSSRIPYKSAVLSVCPPFIEYFPEGDYFRPAHLAVKEFLIAAQDDSISEEISSDKLRIVPAAGHATLAKLLLNCLLSEPAETDRRTPPLLGYATEFWTQHFMAAELDDSLRDKAVRFLSMTSLRRSWLMRWLLMGYKDLPLPKIMQTFRDVYGRLDSSNNHQTISADYLEDFVVILVELDKRRLQGELGEEDVPMSSNAEKIIIIRDLTRTHKQAGRLQYGIKHLEDAMQDLASVPESKPVDYAWVLNSLGIYYDQKGDTDLAIKTQERALEIQLSATPRQNLAMDKIQTVNELGRLFRHTGRYADAQKKHEEALSALKELIPAGTDSQDVVWTQSHLAKTYRAAGSPSDAVELHKETLAVRTRLLGADHLHTLWDLSDLAKCYRDLGELEEACRLQERSLYRREAVLGSKHHDVLWAMNDLGIMYEKANRVDDAVSLHKRALEAQEQTLGKEHGTTIWTRTELSRLQELGG